ncbi:hypothetical protein [Streptomyces otsuchiensis]|uniref:hypothetical protein n=1 Tax=Streptomyces otsuchiensis TaxID=2681388 RepID=UPI00102FF89B|nr:hypothetical protein [Streptomyces otsuchiensis]
MRSLVQLNVSPSHPSPTEPAPAAVAETRPGGTTVRLEQAEAAIVAHYSRLVRLGYLVLPPDLGRHRRVLAAHGLAQRALPPGRTSRLAPAVSDERRLPLPPPRGESAAPPADDPGYACVRERLLRDALDTARRSGRRASRTGRSSRRLPRGPRLLPRVIGLRLAPLPGGADELAMEQALLEAEPATRAAFALARLEALPAPATRELLTSAGLRPEAARQAVEAAAELPGGDHPPLEDPCALRARPGDLLRRRHYRRSAAAVAAAVVLGAGTLVALGGDDPAGRPAPAGEAPDAASAANPVLVASANPLLLERARAGDWQRASRVDFASWEPRGAGVDDAELLGRALTAWVTLDDAVEVTTTPGTATGPPPAPPRLLFAGDIDGTSLVVLHDGLRVVRYTEPSATSATPAMSATPEPSGADSDGSAVPAVPAGAALEFARVDGASAGHPAVVLHRGEDGVRYLTAPWVEGAVVHELLSPGADPSGLGIDRHGVTDPAPTAAGLEDCTTSPLVELTTPDGLPPGVLIDLGEPVPAAVTDSAPGTGHGHPLRGEAAERLARTACHLPTLAGNGVRLVNSWEFATQGLPDAGGEASWVCVRAETWRGKGARTMTQLQLPRAEGPESGEGDGRDFGAPGTVTARTDEGADCTLRDHHLVASAVWRSPDDEWYLLAAGSPGVSRLTAEGDVTGRAEGHTLVLPAERDTEAEVAGVVTKTGAPATALR